MDASYKDDPATTRSTTGYLIQYHGNTIAWRSKIQGTLARSTGQAEYIAVCEATEDILFIGRLIQETLQLNDVFPILLHKDSTVCITQCERVTTQGKLKFMDKKYLEKQTLFEEGLLEVTKIDTENQLADILTKPLPPEKFCKLRTLIMHQNSTNAKKKNK